MKTNIKTNKQITKSNFSFLGINKIFRDIRTLNWKWKVAIVLLALLFSLDTLIFDYGVKEGKHFEWVWQVTFSEQAWHGWSHNFYNYWFVSKVTNGATAFFGVLNVILIATRRISNYFWGILSCVFYGNYAFAAGYTGDAILNVLFYLPMSFVGFWIWNKNLDENQLIKRNHLTWKHLIALLLLIAIMTVCWYFIIPVVDEALRKALFNDATPYYYSGIFIVHFMDAFTNSLGVASTFLMYGRFGQEFMLYIVKDTIGIIMWSGLFNNNILGFDMSIVLGSSAYLISGLAGLLYWLGVKIKKLKPSEIKKLENTRLKNAKYVITYGEN